MHEPVSIHTVPGILLTLGMALGVHALLFGAGLVALGPEDSGRSLEALSWARVKE